MQGDTFVTNQGLPSNPFTSPVAASFSPQDNHPATRLLLRQPAIAVS